MLVILSGDFCREGPMQLAASAWILRGERRRSDDKIRMHHVNLQIRKAVAADIPRLREIIDASVRGLQAADYSPAQIEGALRSVYGVDTQLITDGTYLVAEEASRADPVIVACGGWSKRKTLYGGDQYAGREDSLLDPSHDAAKIRAFFVHPDGPATASAA